MNELQEQRRVVRYGEMSLSALHRLARERDIGIGSNEPDRLANELDALDRRDLTQYERRHVVASLERPNRAFTLEGYSFICGSAHNITALTLSGSCVTVGDGWNESHFTGLVEPAFVEFCNDRACSGGDGGQNSSGTPRRPQSQQQHSLSRLAVESLACGYGHSLFLTTDGQVWMSGTNVFGQLSNDNFDLKISPVAPLRFPGLYGPRFGDAACGRVVQVAAGTFHTVVLFENGQCFSCGCGMFGQLGIGEVISKQPEFRPVQFKKSDLRKMRIRAIFAGGQVSGFIAEPRATPLAPPSSPSSSSSSSSSSGDEREEGERLFMCGGNSCGQLGVGDQTPRPVPKLVNIPANSENCSGKMFSIVDVATTGWHTIVTCGDGRVFSFGSNEYGRCGATDFGTSDTDFLLLPRRVQLDDAATQLASKNERVVRVSLGFDYSLLLSDDGQLLGSGSNDCGQLHTLCEQRGFVPLFRRFSWHDVPCVEPTIRIRDVSCCDNTTAILLDDNRCLTFGSNESGVRGLPNRDDSNIQAALFPSVWRLGEWHVGVPLSAYPLAFRVALRYAVLAWQSPRRAQRVWRRAGTGHVPLLVLERVFGLASFPLGSWRVSLRG